jgi:hypothetical protein
MDVGTVKCNNRAGYILFRARINGHEGSMFSKRYSVEMQRPVFVTRHLRLECRELRWDTGIGGKTALIILQRSGDSYR